MQQSRPNSIVWHSKLLTEFAETSCDSIEGIFKNSASITSLLFAIFPSAICRFVISIGINPAKAGAIGTGAHIFKEFFKGLLPPFADFNTTSPIGLVTRAIFVCASLDHASPTVVFGRDFVPKSMPMSYKARSGMFFAETSTGSSIAANQTCIQNQHRVSAFTLTYASNVFLAVWKYVMRTLSYHIKSSKLFSDESYFVWHNGLFVCASGGHPTTIGDRCAILTK